MASTYRSLYLITGRRAGNIKQIINNALSGEFILDERTSKICYCPSPINSKIIKNSNQNVIPGTTQRERAVNAIKYATGGRVVYGNDAYQSSGNTLLGRLQGQPLSPFLSRNKF
jgi:hypothetical protein